MRQNDIYRPRPTDVALSGSSGSQRALHIGQLQVVLDAARKDPEVDNAVGFLEELATMCSVARGWLVTAHSDYRAAEAGPDPSRSSASETAAVLPAGPPAAEDLAAGAEPAELVSPPSLLEPRGYVARPTGGS